VFTATTTTTTTEQISLHAAAVVLIVVSIGMPLVVDGRLYFPSGHRPVMSGRVTQYGAWRNTARAWSYIFLSIFK
jgi:hypothetical protein